MNRKRLIIIAFILVAVAQMFVPYRMINEQAKFIDTGKEFRFKIRSNHARSFRGDNTGSSIRGRYIWLLFEEDRFKVTDQKSSDFNHPFYVLFTKDSLGFAKVESVTKHKPEFSSDWVKARVWLYFKDTTLMQLNYPFNNYYIEDLIDKDIESKLSDKLNDSLSVISLNVKIKENQFIVNDLMIDSVSFKDFVKKIQGKPNN
jgi:hypothetical protein